MTSEPERTAALSENTIAPSDNIDIVEEQEGGDGIDHTEEPESEAPVIEEEDKDDTPFFSASDDPENARNYKEYKSLVKEIQFQNSTIEDIKNQIHNINCKPCLANSERKQLNYLYGCLEQEMQKSQCLMEKVIRLQNFGSRRRYKEINMVTTFEEDQMNSISLACETMQMQTSRGPETYWRASGGDTTSDVEKSCSYRNSTDLCESDEQMLLDDLLATLPKCTNCNKGKNPIKKKKSHSSKDESMGKLRQRIVDMQHSINKINEEISRQKDDNKSKDPCPCHKTNHKSRSTSNQHICPSSCATPKAQQFQMLKDNYMYLLTEFNKKEEELKEITNRLKSSCGSGGGTTVAGYNADASEIHLLTNRINDLKEEQIEFKCLMREQSSQLEDYRNKYLTAQQKVEEQCALIEKLNMNNKRIEMQINLEIKEIRCKFQEKLKELQRFPKLLENEQIKVAKLCKEKEDLESKLMIVCKELKTHKNMSGMQGSGEVTDTKSQLQKCQKELDQTKKTLEDIQRQRDLYCEQLKVTQEDLDCLRSESAKIIARLKERSDLIKHQQQEQINRMEKQLAQCRATACLSVSDRECVIREMQGQLNTLSYSFDAAQKQIKTLRNHIAYMSNENCFPAKC